jgi:hypothetical protein
MNILDNETKRLLLYRNINDSLSPIVKFCEQHDIYIYLLHEIFNNFNIKDIYSALGTISHVINSHPTQELNPTFAPSLNQIKLKFYIFSWDRLNLKNIPFEKWSDLAEEGIKLLKDLIEENKLENFKNDPRYRDFMKRFIQRHEDLRLSGEYPDLNELMDD